MKIVNNDICNHQYQSLFLKGQKSFIGNNMLCANSQWGVDTCQVRSACTGQRGGFLGVCFPFHMALVDFIKSSFPLASSFPVCKM